MSSRVSGVFGLVSLIGVATSTAIGCAADGRDGVDGQTATEDNLGYRVGASVLPTDKSTLRLFEGYNSLLDEGFSSCVTSSNAGEGPPLSVGNVSERFEIRYVDSRVDLANELGIDLGLGVKYGPINIGFNFGFLNSYRKSNTSVSFILRAVQSYTVSNHRSVALLPEMLELLKTDPATFTQRCGDGYVNGISYTAELSVLIRFDSQSEETARQIKAELAGGGGVATAGQDGTIDGSLRTRLVNSSRRQGVSASVVVGTEGFLASGAPSAGSFVSLGTGITDETFERIEELGTAMGTSLADDICSDGGSAAGICGPKAPGYEANTGRNARPSSVLFAGYNKATNAPTVTAGFNPYREVQEKLKKSEDYLRTFAVLQTKMENAYYNEIQPFLDATPEGRANFNVLPPAAPMLKPQAVTEMVERWRAKFQPNDGSRVGTIADEAFRFSDACWQGLRLGDYTDCHLELNGRADQRQEYGDIRRELDRYVAEGRVLPLRYGKGNNALYGNASCNDLPLVPGARLPSGAEIAALAPVIASVAKDGKAWYKDEAGRCQHDPYFENPLTGGPSSLDQAYKCHEAGWYQPWAWLYLDTICVPQNGPFGSVPNL